MDRPEKEVIDTALNDGPFTILLVDDQRLTAKAVRNAFAGEPLFCVHHCVDEHTAVSFAHCFHPTVILQDLVMPGVDGLDLLKQYRSHPSLQDVPVIVLSSEENPVIKREAFRLGASDYVIKSADAIELVARVRHHIERHRMHAELHAAYRVLHETQQKLLRANAELEQLNRTDDMTGLYNRRFLDEYLATEWKRAVRDKTPLSILMLDVDHFKRYNDTYGHVAGDEVLRVVAQALHATFTRPADRVGRFGGEEFMAVLPNTPSDGARHIAKKACAAVEALQVVHAASVAGVVTVSIGVATAMPTAGDALVHLMGSADASLYDAKKLGRNRLGKRFAGVGAGAGPGSDTTVSTEGHRC